MVSRRRRLLFRLCRLDDVFDAGHGLVRLFGLLQRMARRRARVQRVEGVEAFREFPVRALVVRRKAVVRNFDVNLNQRKRNVV